MGFRGIRSVGFFLGLGVFWATHSAAAISLDGLNESETTLLKSTLKNLDPLVTERKADGTAPLMSFKELYTPLTPKQIDFLEGIRHLDPASLSGSSRKLSAPAGDESFIRLESQAILKEGKPTRLDSQYLPRLAFEAYQAMMAAMEADLGKRLLVESGYRSPAYQLYLFLFYLPKHGTSILETNRHVALPGCSEHGSPPFQAIDFITPAGINGEDRPEEFEELQEYGWLKARAHEFGFTLSYPRGGTSAFEPWHWHWEGSRREG